MKYAIRFNPYIVEKLKLTHVIIEVKENLDYEFEKYAAGIHFQWYPNTPFEHFRGLKEFDWSTDEVMSAEATEALILKLKNLGRAD